MAAQRVLDPKMKTEHQTLKIDIARSPPHPPPNSTAPPPLLQLNSVRSQFTSAASDLDNRNLV